MKSFCLTRGTCLIHVAEIGQVEIKPLERVGRQVKGEMHRRRMQIVQGKRRATKNRMPIADSGPGGRAVERERRVGKIDRLLQVFLSRED